jgi:DNA-binding NtrC family response regulator
VAFCFPEPSPNILVVDDERMIRWTLRAAFEDAGGVVEEAADLAEAREKLTTGWPDLLVLDLKLPDGSGMDLLAEIKVQDAHLPVLIITAFGSLKGAVVAMQAGAFDYLAKPFELDDLLLKASRALEQRRLRQGKLLQSRDTPFSWPVAESPASRKVLTLLQKVGRAGASSVLLSGESGTGKGLAARTLHASAVGGDDTPFVPVSCTSITETLLESELFGHEKGAFTDAKESKIGLAELAAGGTLFLDEIGDLPPAMQAKLLTLLEDRVFRRVGGTREISLKARVVTATHRNLELEVQRGNFRQDLFFRLKVVPIEIPPLRHRLEDIRPLAEFFLTTFQRELGSSVSSFHEEALMALDAYAWPGNVRELRNSIERAVLLCGGNQILLEDLPPEIADIGMGQLPSGALSSDGGPTRPDGLLSLPEVGVDLTRQEKAWVEDALERAGGNRTQAAKWLGLSRDQIRYRIEKFDLKG